jgi:GNAT superfamily N-acetyltransferase
LSEELFRISTTFWKSAYGPSVLEFVVECRPIRSDDGEVAAEAVGTLDGFLMEPGYLPEGHDEGYHGAFDERSVHATEAYSILVNQRPLIANALPKTDLLDRGNGVALLERAHVLPEYRGKALTLRLMREAKHTIGRYGLLVILKAHPDGDEISDVETLRLATYYTSDKRLGFKALSKKRLPGWLVANWDEPEAAPGDDCYWYAK